jgi:tetratricopeptide (TPR) repeat protein
MRRPEARGPRLLAAAASLASLFFLAAGAPPPGPAGSPEELLARGNDAYARGDYAAAAESYRRILESGIRNGRVYYNLGNACFRQNRIGEAILYYEKTLKLDPTDPDARENLRYANLRIRDRIPADDLPVLLAILERARNLLRLEQVVPLFTGLYLAAMACAAAWILGNGRRWAPAVGVAALGLLSLVLIAGGWMFLQGRARDASNAAIVLSEKVDVLSGPGTENTLLASVHEGTKVRIHNRRDPWVQVTLPDGRAGWMKGDALGTI